MASIMLRGEKREKDMSLEEAKRCVQQGLLLEAEDLYWTEIESGNLEARLLLAYAFHDVGLNSLALEHYRELEGTEKWADAAPQIAEILLDVHLYEQARKSVDNLANTDVAKTLAAIESVENKTASYINEIPEIVQEQLAQEAVILSAVANEPNLQMQLELVQVREYLAHYASVVSTELGEVVAHQAIAVGIGGMVVSRELSMALGTPARRWFEAAHSAVNALTLMHEQSANGNGEFTSISLRAMSSIEKKYVIAGRELTEVGEDFAINNLLWALNELNSPAKDFYAYLLPDG